MKQWELEHLFILKGLNEIVIIISQQKLYISSPNKLYISRSILLNANRKFIWRTNTPNNSVNAPIEIYLSAKNYLFKCLTRDLWPHHSVSMGRFYNLTTKTWQLRLIVFGIYYRLSLCLILKNMTVLIENPNLSMNKKFKVILHT